MNQIAIFGAGGFGRETALLIRQINQAEPQWNLIGFFDDGLKKDTIVEGLPVLGGLPEVNMIAESLSLVVAVADPRLRMNIVNAIKNEFVSFPVIAHPGAILGSETNWFGRGTIITAGCVLTTGIVMGEFTIINLMTTIGHDAQVGSFCSIMPGCSISGNVTIGEGCFLGTGVRILQNVTIGKTCVVGAGAVVIKNFADDLTIVGVPASSIK